MRYLFSSCAWSLIVASLITLCGPIAEQAHGQSTRGNPLPKVTYLQNSDSAPGVVGAGRLLRGGPVLGFFQPVEVAGPEKLEVALAESGQFLPPLPAPVKVGMLVGSVYRLRVTNIPLRPGEELYPTIEVLDRLYSPRGREHRFPIPIVLEQEDLWRALDGGMVTRVIYLEDSQVASATADLPGEQRVTDVVASDNALQVADQLGRPMAILRIGSRVPADLQGDLSGFLFNSPPWMPLPPVPTQKGLVDAGLIPDVPVPEPPAELRRQTIPNEPRLPPAFIR